MMSNINSTLITFDDRSFDLFKGFMYLIILGSTIMFFYFIIILLYLIIIYWYDECKARTQQENYSNIRES